MPSRLAVAALLARLVGGRGLLGRRHAASGADARGGGWLGVIGAVTLIAIAAGCGSSSQRCVGEQSNAVAVAECARSGSPTGSAAVPAPPRSATRATEAVAVTRAKPTRGGLHGIVLLRCGPSGAVELQWLDAASVKVRATRTFASGAPGDWTVARECSGLSRAPAEAYRSMFNSDWSQMVVVSADQESPKIATLSDRGVLHVLTKAPNGFASTPEEGNPSFDPATNAIAFLRIVNDQGSYMLRQANGSLRVLEPSDDTLGEVTDEESPYMARGLLLSATNDEIARPDGHATATKQYDSDDAQYQGQCQTGCFVLAQPNQPGGQIINTGTLARACEYLAVWYTAQSMLCDVDDGTIARIDLHSDGSTTFTPLLPRTDRTNGYPWPSPDHKRFAFLSSRDNDVTLYTTSLSREQTPTTVAHVDQYTHIIGWEP